MSALLELGPLSNDFRQAFDDVLSVAPEDLAQCIDGVRERLQIAGVRHVGW
ncbi:hypothetical protein [Methylobacterium sp. PvR107]|uniref:hypothetical protein n=1 Tax=Methylobacterium sp. PvR107 TaxID=2806597 RepID=UPI001AE27D0C|nr:hypothetical protein [Methylobacterium sp. PvR107]MBP1178261.1 hypothetical protein [Methylobacterium sp. PvR107]